MSLESQHAPRTVKGKAIAELQGFTTKVVAGDAAATDIPVAGIKTTDTLQSVIEFKPATPAVIDRTSEASITSDGNIQLSTTDTTSSQLTVSYWVKPT